MIKLIASDLDGTLLQNEAQELTPRAIDLISQLTQKGIHFVAASGRQYDNERRVFLISQRMVPYAFITVRLFPAPQSTRSFAQES